MRGRRKILLTSLVGSSILAFATFGILAPLVPPQCGSLPLAVLHKQAVAELRMELAEWL